MTIATTGNRSHCEQQEKLPPCRFPLPPNLMEFSTGNVSSVQQTTANDEAIPERELSELDEERLLNARQVAERLGVSERWVRDHTTRRSPKIRGVKLGMMMRYRRADVDLFMQELGT